MTRTPSARPVALAALAAGILAAAAPADVVILRDGFVIQGTVRKESEAVTDKATGQTVTVPKGNGFDMVDDGARVVIFSSHQRQLGEIAKDAKVRPDYKAYENKITSRKDNQQLPGITGFEGLPDFDAKWRRTLKAFSPDGFHLITQQVTYLDPYCCYVASTTHLWTQAFRTSEMDPHKVRKLLATYPDPAAKDGKDVMDGKGAQPDVTRRVAIARFMKEAGWLQLAKDDLAALKADAASLPQDAREQINKFEAELNGAVGELAATEAELALKAGRHKYASDLVAAFPHPTAGPKEADRITRVGAELKTAREGYEAARRLLRAVADDIGGAADRVPFAAVAGPAAQLVPPPALDPKTARLAAAAEQVLAELHPAAADRVTIFVDLAGQAARERAAGKPASYRPDQLLATAVSGWVRGKNGASTDPDAAAKAWAAREAVLAYQRGINTNDRQAVLREYQRAYPLGLDELATVISMLPPAEPEDLAARTGTAVRPGPGVPEGVYRRKTGPHNQHPAGVEYLVKLPPEYHHGRAYPVLVVMGYAGIDPEKMVGALATEADRHGYVVVAPVWAPAFGPQTRWTYDPDDHDFVTGPLRDVVRHFAVDNDRVFLLGFGGGADAALDVGASHPDLFAGVIPVCPNPRWQGLFIEYWRNAQKLPVYAVTGQMALEGNVNIRRVFERWMPNGFPAVQVIYKGRGIEWFPAEVPVMFDWMGRKKRANGTATLQLGAGARQRWQTIRASDDRFYWLGADAIDPKNLAVNYPPGRTVTPAQLDGDIRNGNLITVRAQGVRRVSVWLGKEMIDWAQPVRVSLNGQPLAGWKPRVLEPDMGVLLEDYYRRGDRRMLYLARIEFPNAN